MSKRYTKTCIVCLTPRSLFSWYLGPTCGACKRREFRCSNRALDNAKKAGWRKQNHDKVRRYKANWRKDNIEAARVSVRKHYYNNKEYYIENAAFYRARKYKATPSWVCRDDLRRIYLNRPSGYHVDHIVPLNGSNVCGLHVPWNLQYLPAKENLQKSNRYGDY